MSTETDKLNLAMDQVISSVLQVNFENSEASAADWNAAMLRARDEAVANMKEAFWLIVHERELRQSIRDAGGGEITNLHTVTWGVTVENDGSSSWLKKEEPSEEDRENWKKYDH